MPKKRRVMHEFSYPFKTISHRYHVVGESQELELNNKIGILDKKNLKLKDSLKFPLTKGALPALRIGVNHSTLVAHLSPITFTIAKAPTGRVKAELELKDQKL